MGQKKQKQSAKVTPESKYSLELEIKARQKLRDIADGKWVTIVMTLFTLWALFGDDMRLCFTKKPADDAFYATFLVCLVLFFVELIVNSLVFDDYKFGFFFWLDVIATISLIPDVPWLIDPFYNLFNITVRTVEVDYNTSSHRSDSTASMIQKFLKSFRLIRLVRIVKLYKYCVKTKSDEADDEKYQKKHGNQSNNMLQENDQVREMEPARLGKKLSDKTTRRVIIVVLAMLFFLPILQSVPSDNAKHYGLQQLFWVGRSNCTEILEFGCQEINKPWVNEYGWNDLLWRYSRNSEDSEGSNERYPLLWLYLPDLANGGRIGDITKIVKDKSKNKVWYQSKKCQGKQLHGCDLRDDEMELVVYSPHICQERDLGCEKLQAYARYDIRADTKNSAAFNMIVTVFVGFVIAAANFTLTIDVDRIVISPISAMIKLIEDLAQDPLKKQEEKSKEKSVLQQSILKIGQLIIQSFGEDGASIVSKSMRGPNGELNIMRQGEKVEIIFGYCQINEFSWITEQLLDEVLVFFNKIGKIVHNCSTLWQGCPQSNNHGSYLIIWRLPEEFKSDNQNSKEENEEENEDKNEEDDEEEKEDAKGEEGQKEKNQDKEKQKEDKTPEKKEGHSVVKQELADRALIGFIKIIAELKRAADIAAYSKHPKIQKSKEEHYQVQVGLALHVGTAIEGAIGSEFYKVDAAYISIHQDITEKLVHAALEVYKKSIYTFDVTDEPATSSENHEIGQIIKISDTNELQSQDTKHSKDISYVWKLDADIVYLQKKIPFQLYINFRQAFAAYISGNWAETLESLKVCDDLYPRDGPVISLLDFINENGGKPPEDWAGYRVLF